KLRASPTPPLFPYTTLFRSHGQRLTRFGAHKQLRHRLQRLQPQHPELAQRKLSPHSLRHTTAMHLLQSGVDITIIALWLEALQADRKSTRLNSSHEAISYAV